MDTIPPPFQTPIFASASGRTTTSLRHLQPQKHKHNAHYSSAVQRAAQHVRVLDPPDVSALARLLADPVLEEEADEEPRRVVYPCCRWNV